MERKESVCGNMHSGFNLQKLIALVFRTPNRAFFQIQTNCNWDLRRPGSISVINGINVGLFLTQSSCKALAMCHMGHYSQTQLTNSLRFHKIFLSAVPINSFAQIKKSHCISETAIENQMASWFVQTVTLIISPSWEYIRIDIIFNPVSKLIFYIPLLALCCHVLRLYWE